MKTLIELGKDGSRVVYHSSGKQAWTHPEGDPYMIDFVGRIMPLAVPEKQPCPVCMKKES